LVPLNLASGVNNKGGDLPARLREPFHPEDRGHRIRSRPLRHGLECPLLPRLIKGPYFKILSPQTRQISFRETRDLRTLGRGFGQEPLDLVQALLKGGGDTRRRQGDDHGEPPMRTDSTNGLCPGNPVASQSSLARTAGKRDVARIDVGG